MRLSDISKSQTVQEWNNLGIAYRIQGAFYEAINSHLYALTFLSSQNSKTHYDLAITYYYLAECYIGIGVSEEVAQYYAKIKLSIDSSINEAISYEKEAKFKEAMNSYQITLSITNFFFSLEDHFLITQSLQVVQLNINALIFKENGNFIEAINCYERILGLRIIYHKPIFYENIAENYISSAGMHEVNQNFEDAIWCYQRIIQIYGVLTEGTEQFDTLYTKNFIDHKVQKLNFILSSTRAQEEIVEDISSEIIAQIKLAVLNELLEQREAEIDDAIAEITQDISSEVIAQIKLEVLNELLEQREAETDDAIAEITQDISSEVIAQLEVFNELLRQREAEIDDAIAKIIQDILSEALTELEVEREAEIRINTSKITQDILSEASAELSTKEDTPSPPKRKKSHNKKKETKDIEDSSIKIISPDLKEKIKKLHQEGNEHLQENRFDEAISCFKEAVKLNIQVEAPKHTLDKALSYSYLGDTYKKQGDLDRAIKSYKISISTYETTQQNSYEKIAFLSDKVSVMLFEQGKFNEAAEYLKKIFNIYKILCISEITAEIACLFKTIKHIYAKTDDITSMYVAAIRAFQVIQSFPEHDLRRTIEDELLHITCVLANKCKVDPEKILKIIAKNINNYKFTSYSYYKTQSPEYFSIEEKFIMSTLEYHEQHSTKYEKVDLILSEMFNWLKAIAPPQIQDRKIFTNPIATNIAVAIIHVEGNHKKLGQLITLMSDKEKSGTFLENAAIFGQKRALSITNGVEEDVFPDFDLVNVVFFVIKELIEGHNKYKYIAKEILHLDDLIPSSLQQMITPNFLKQAEFTTLVSSSFFWSSMHYLSFYNAVKPVLNNDFKKYIMISSVTFGLKDHIMIQKQLIMNGYESSFLKCAYVVGLQVSADILNKQIINNIIVIGALEPFYQSTILVNAVLEGTQCIKTHLEQEGNYKPSKSSYYAASIVDLTVLYKISAYFLNKNINTYKNIQHLKQANTIIKILYVAEIAMVASAIVAADQTTKLVAFISEKDLIHPAIDYIGKTYNSYFYSDNHADE